MATLAEVAALGKQCLIECEGQMKNVRGEPLDYSYNSPVTEELKEPLECFLSGISAETVRPAIERFLAKLASLGGLTMSEAIPKESMWGLFENVSYKNLRLSFVYGTQAIPEKHFLWIVCWYRPLAN